MWSLQSHKLVLLGTIAAYCLIGVEIVIMISPFALYFYSVYGPILTSLSASPLTSWTTEFFLPHMVFTNDLLINTISYLQILMVIGLLLFFSAALPLYYGRFTGKGVVQFSFYSKVRHPQYLFLAISGFGLLLYWPRFIILVMYVTMLFVYYALARNEEWRMKHESGEPYERYMVHTPMFLPGEPGGKLYRLLFGWIKPKWLGILVTYLVTMAVAVVVAYELRSYTVRQLPVVRISQNFTLVPVFDRPAAEVLGIYEAIRQEPEVVAALAEKGGSNLAYVMPGDFFLTALVTDENRRFSDAMIERFPEILEWHQYKFSGSFFGFSTTMSKNWGAWKPIMISNVLSSSR
jgi:protein-S-isoprenylcysteine O-methyltransferase Ste14